MQRLFFQHAVVCFQVFKFWVFCCQNYRFVKWNFFCLLLFEHGSSCELLCFHLFSLFLTIGSKIIYLSVSLTCFWFDFFSHFSHFVFKSLIDLWWFFRTRQGIRWALLALNQVVHYAISFLEFHLEFIIRFRRPFSHYFQSVGSGFSSI